MIKFIELFAGIGGFRYGLERMDPSLRTATNEETDIAHRGSPGSSGNSTQERRQSDFACVYSNEWDKYAAQIYRRHYGEIDTRDITTVDVSEIPEHDLLTAGFPCQAFSVAGKRLGFQDTRGTLFFEIARVLKSKRPRHFLLENVKGLLSHEQGQTFNTILGILSDLGYRVEWMVLNSKHFGVPQNRERVFIVGHLRGECSGEVFPVRQQDSGANEQVVSTAIDSNYWKGIDNHGQRTMIQIGSVGRTKHNSIQDRVYDTSGIARTIAGEAGGKGAKTGMYKMGNRIRRLTPIECERLQGFPDGWTEFGLTDKGELIITGTEKDLELLKISDTQRYKCLGNAVTTTVIQVIGTELLKHLIEEN